ncbi:MAG: hypothetical protein LBO00_02740 [Zoogloeaceae bacterium]|jgi:hypothetical protein|nr:hypothetical protein [Zoogloeaceae bacterium]
MTAPDEHPSCIVARVTQTARALWMLLAASLCLLAIFFAVAAAPIVGVILLAAALSALLCGRHRARGKMFWVLWMVSVALWLCLSIGIYSGNPLIALAAILLALPLPVLCFFAGVLLLFYPSVAAKVLEVLRALLKYWLAVLAINFHVALISLVALPTPAIGVPASILAWLAALASVFVYRQRPTRGKTFWTLWIVGLALWLCVGMEMAGDYTHTGSGLAVFPLMALALVLGFFIGVPLLFFLPFASNFLLYLVCAFVALALALIVSGFRKRQHKYGKTLLMAGLILWNLLGIIGLVLWLGNMSRM